MWVLWQLVPFQVLDSWKCKKCSDNEQFNAAQINRMEQRIADLTSMLEMAEEKNQTPRRDVKLSEPAVPSTLITGRTRSRIGEEYNYTRGDK